MSALELTQAGQKQAEDTTGRGPDFTVLSLLYENNGGPVDFDEIMEKLNTDEVKASMIVRGLISEGYVREV